jgi:hypothetical protein
MVVNNGLLFGRASEAPGVVLRTAARQHRMADVSLRGGVQGLVRQRGGGVPE